jgi:hypothetical protein
MSEPDSVLSRGLSILLIIIGGILLLPGICAGFFMLTSLRSPGSLASSELLGLWITCFAVSAGGLLLVVWAARRLA